MVVTPSVRDAFPLQPLPTSTPYGTELPLRFVSPVLKTIERSEGVTTTLPSALGNATKSICPPRPARSRARSPPALELPPPPPPLGLSDPRTHSAGSFPRPACPRSALACTLSLPLALRRPAATPSPEPGRNPEATSVAPGVLSPTRDSAAAAPAAPHPPHRRPTTGAPPGVGTTAGAPRLRRTGLGQTGDPQGGTSEFGRRGLGTERRGESPGGAERPPQ